MQAGCFAIVQVFCFAGLVSRDFLHPERSALPPWRRCLYCQSFALWDGTLPFCALRQQVLACNAALDRRCDRWTAGPTPLQPNAWCAPIDAELHGVASELAQSADGMEGHQAALSFQAQGT